MRVLFEFESSVSLGLRVLEDQLQVGQLLLDGICLAIEMKRGRMTGRQAQISMTAGSVVDQTAKATRPP